MELTEKNKINERLAHLGLSITDSKDSLEECFDITSDFKAENQDKVVEYTEDFLEQKLTQGEYILSMISLGNNEKERLFLAVKSHQMIGQLEDDLISVVNNSVEE